MKKLRISVTEASRNFAECVNRVRYQGLSFELVKGGRPVALLVPKNFTVCPGRRLAEVLAGLDLPKGEARSWRRDLQAARKVLTAPRHKWP